MTKYSPGQIIPPPNPVSCPSPDCTYVTPEGLPDFQLITEHLNIHVRLVHPPVPAPVTGGGGQAAKLDKKVRPTATLGMSELDWRFYVSEWSRYTRQTHTC